MLGRQNVTARGVASEEDKWKRERRVQDREFDEPIDCIHGDACVIY